LPTAEQFSLEMTALGVRDDRAVVCYDTVGLFSAARLWWMLLTFGHAKAYVLDGGLRAWRAAGFPVDAGVAAAAVAGAFAARKKAAAVQNMDGVATALQTGKAQLVDARSPTRFRGEEPEPRPGVRPGHMPGAKNVHYASLLNADGTMKDEVSLHSQFAAAGVDVTAPIITTCGSGVTAAILSLALTELGAIDHQLYDGSWAQWGASAQAVAVGA
jgi:thiosulfate/3-mercaptopyruvate sulfurtransferase